jgi:hypothetical protein
VQVLAQIIPTGPLKHIFNHVAWLEHQQNPVTPFWICLQNDHKRFEACFNSKANMMTLYYDFTPQLDHTISTTACVFILAYEFQRWVPATTTIVKQHKTCKVMLCQNWGLHSRSHIQMSFH